MFKQMSSKTGVLSRFLLRQDRFRIPIWLLSLSGITLLTAQAFTGLYATEENRQTIAQTMVNPAMTAMVGKGYGLDNYTFGAMLAHQMLLFTAVTVAIMSILLVARHTRAEEEDGRLELIRSLPAGRLASLNATLIVVIGVNILLALLTAAGLYALGIESIDLEGSLLYGAALAASGIVFAAITAFFSQLSESSRGTIGLSFAALGAAYFIRAIGDVSNETLSWFSPLGWVTGTEVYVNDYWWPILLTLGVSLILIMASLYINSIRDLDAGFLPSRLGKTRASTALQSPIGLALRMQRTGIIAWAIGVLLIGASYGSIFGDLDTFFEDMEIMKDLLSGLEGGSLTEQFIAKLMSIIAMICTIPALMAVFKLKGEEKKGRTEHLLARAVSRNRLLASYMLISLTVGFVMLSLAAIGLGAAAVAVLEDGPSLATIYGAAMVYLPALAIFIGLAVLLIGLLPKLTGITWLYLGYSFFVVYLGGVFQFDEWVGNLTPFGHVPELPIEDVNAVVLILLTIIAAVLTTGGFIGYRNRDIQG